MGRRGSSGLPLAAGLALTALSLPRTLSIPATICRARRRWGK
jgi:hypothetical protein